jgi:hypothetical protein
MRFIAFWTILTLNLGAYAQDFEPGALLRCLAQEEELLHKTKQAGPHYKLNQLFFNEWAGNPSLELTQAAFDRVCGQGIKHPSIFLLKEFMLGGKRIFRASKLPPDDPMTIMQKITLEELRRQMPQVFFSYVADLEALAPSANCLEVEIPGLAKLREKYRYLESEISMQFLDEHREEWKQVFEGLVNWQTHFQTCQKRLDQKIKEEKKKANSSPNSN